MTSISTPAPRVNNLPRYICTATGPAPNWRRLGEAIAGIIEGWSASATATCQARP